MKVYGKLVANAILNKQYLGIDFSEPLIKLVLGKDIEF